MSSSNKDTYNKSRCTILSYVLNFTTKRYYGENHQSRVSEDEAWRGGYTMDKNPPIGSLCMLMAAPDSKYYLGWLLQTRNGGIGTEYLLQSIEDHSTCWWSNVGICYYPKANEFPSWKWSDRQFEFKDKWMRAVNRVDEYLTKPLYPVFHDDGSVTLGTRPHAFVTAIDNGDYRPTKTFPNWKKVTSKEMQEFFKHAHTSTPKNLNPQP